VIQVDCRIHARRLKHTNRPDPQSALEAKFSLQYCVARALIHGKVVLEHFEGAAFRDPQARRIAQRVHAAPYTQVDFDSSNHFGAEVAVKLDGGQTYSKKVQTALGRISANPIPPELLKAKFESCAGRVLPPDQVAELHASIQQLERVRSVRRLTAMMAITATPQAVV
jgi:2-methylcitrate dehydratase PrpD